MMQRGVTLGILAVVSGVITLALARAEPALPLRAAGETVACRVLEAHTSDRDRATVVIFHQRNKADGPRLGELIRALDGKSVRFEMGDAKYHTAMLFRLKSCFGRGLLL